MTFLQVWSRVLCGSRFVMHMRLVTALCLTLFITACATLPDNSTRSYSQAMTNTDDTVLGMNAGKQRATHPGLSGFVPLSSGLDAFVARVVLASRAERSIDAQYYLFHNDITGTLLLGELITAADRGVRVRLLVDDMAIPDGDLGAILLDQHPNLEIRIFNPFSRNTSRISQFATRFGSVTRRMHNKSFTADNQFTIVGGRNIGDEYFEANPELAFGDLDVLAVGPVVLRISASFDEYWNHALAYPIRTLASNSVTPEKAANANKRFEQALAAQESSQYRRAMETSALADKLRKEEMTYYWGNAQVVHDSPDKISEDRDRKDLHLAPQLKTHFDNVDDELIIFSPYFVPGKEGVEFLSSLAERGVRVSVVTNSLASTDVAAVHAGYAKYRKGLLRAGVELWEINERLPRKERARSGVLGSSGKASLHTKSFVLDREQVFIGSLNLDPRSVVENTELGIVISSPEMGRELSAWFDSNIANLAFRLELQAPDAGGEQIVWHGMEDGRPVTFTQEPYSGFWRRLGVSTMSLLPVESQL